MQRYLSARAQERTEWDRHSDEDVVIVVAASC